MGKNSRTRLIKLQDFLKQTNAKIVGGLGLGGGIRTMYRQLSVLESEKRALKNSDLWLQEGIRDEKLLARNRITQSKVEIPLECVAPSLRRQSGVEYLDVTTHSDFLLTNNFSCITDFLCDQSLNKRFEKNKKAWKEYINRRKGTVFIGRKFDLSAPGTRLVGFYSSIPLTPGEFWTLTNLDSEFSRILSLWFNSTPNLVQMFLNRTETRGAWMKNDVGTLKDTYILDPRSLENSERTTLLEVFDLLSTSQFPSILEQMKTIYPARKKMDEALLRIIGFSEYEAQSILNYLYPAFQNEIAKLKILMDGKGEPDNSD
jgi:hypothetical protein